MIVVNLVLALVALVIGLAVFGIAVAAVVGLVLLWWPALIGIPLTIVIWRAGADNIASLLFLGAAGLQFWWFYKKMDDGGSDPTDPPSMAGKKRTYNVDGSIRGYEDR